MSIVSPYLANTHIPPYVPKAPFGSQADFFGLNRAASQFNAVQNPIQQQGWLNYNNLIGNGMNAAFGGAPTGPIQNLSNRLAAELYGGGDINAASLMPNTNLQPWHLATYGSGIGSIFDPIHRATPTGIGGFGMLNNNTANAFAGSFNPNTMGINGFSNNRSISWPAMFQSQNYVNPLQLQMGHHGNPNFGGSHLINNGIMDYSAFLGLQVANQAHNPFAHSSIFT